MRAIHAIAVFVLCATLAQAQTILPKHYAVPADELRSGHLSLPSAEALTQESNAALLPLEWVSGSATMRFTHDGSPGLRVVVLSPNAEDWSVSLTTPSNARAAMDLRTEPLGGIGIDGRAPVVTPLANEAGEWTLGVDPRGTAGEAWVLIGSESGTKLGSSIGATRVVGDAVAIDSEGVGGEVINASARITDPDGIERVVDLETINNESRGAFVPEVPGTHRVHITATVRTPNGREVVRTTTHLVQVSERLVELDRNGVARAEEGVACACISIPTASHIAGAKVFVAGELWSDGEPVCWVGGMTTPQRDGSLELDLDPRWFAGWDKRHELRNVRVQDPEGWGVIGWVKGIELAVPEQLTNGAFEGEPALVAPRNEARALPNEEYQNVSRVAGGHNLMLVHGYCSSNVWGPSVGVSFTGDTELFLDLGENRSHDQFAQLIAAFGANQKSFGIVAHSQGGAAALTLSTFYFSGLDWASDGTVIQSLGTPYQGTPLAGSAAILGDIFGTGCGSNSDLSTDGAPLWLANIPNEQRAKVHYWTTSFPSGSSACNFFSGLLLSNPEDGVIEVARGQLPGATNMGNLTGWCHSSGMSFPAQTTDQTRNAFMNGAAAR